MKAAALALLAVLVSACAWRQPLMDTRDTASRSGLPADTPYTAHYCRYAQTLPGDDFADFVGATCVVFQDRLTIVRPRATIMSSSYFRYRALDGISLAATGSQSQLQMRAAGTVLVVQMEVEDGGAQQRAFSSAQKEGVPVFTSEFVRARSGMTFVPPAF